MFGNITTRIRKFRDAARRLAKDLAGVTAVEYGLIAAGIAVAIMTVVTNVGTSLNAEFGTIITNLP